MRIGRSKDVGIPSASLERGIHAGTLSAGSRGDVEVRTYSLDHIGESEPSRVRRARQAWVRKGRRSETISDTVGAMENNDSTVSYYSYSRLRTFANTVFGTLRNMRLRIRKPRSAQLLVDSEAQTATLYMGTTPRVRHSDITRAVGDAFEGLFRHKSKALHSGHIADVRLPGATEATVFVDDRMDTEWQTGKYPASDVHLARQLSRRGMLVIGSNGDVVE